MAEPVIPPKVKLFVGILFSQEAHLFEAEKKLVKKFGPIDYSTKYIPFSHTTYYKNMGSRLNRIFFSFRKPIEREKMPAIKLYTNRLEKKISPEGTRKINLDPGYLTLSNVFLASCKDYFHRMYIGKGVYLENELKYVAKKFESWEWTYPDYKNPDYLHFFYKIREMYHNELKKT